MKVITIDDLNYLRKHLHADDADKLSLIDDLIKSCIELKQDKDPVTDNLAASTIEIARNEGYIEGYNSGFNDGITNNPWQPIDTAQTNKRVLVYIPVVGQIVSKDAGRSLGATHWRELPADPK